MNFKLILDDPARRGVMVAVEFDTDNSIRSVNQLLRVLQKGVTEWMRTTARGSEHYADAGTDFHIGDLACLSRIEITEILGTTDGLLGIRFHSEFEQPFGWLYRTSLCPYGIGEDDDE